jgi:hypothetical protein
MKPVVEESRLARLDREMHVERSKHFEYVYATRNEFRIRVCISRIRDAQPGDYRYVATCSIGGHVHRVFGHLPSHAFTTLAERLRHVTRKLSYQRAELEYRMSKNRSVATI